MLDISKPKFTQLDSMHSLESRPELAAEIAGFLLACDVDEASRAVPNCPIAKVMQIHCDTRGRAKMRQESRELRRCPRKAAQVGCSMLFLLPLAGSPRAMINVHVRRARASNNPEKIHGAATRL